ncbi:Protein prune [Liparis tanakae]|uniref:Protein prune n=1 Tax=Liparis tanakae TaxID=230148 RepID=A0A4Z2ESQ8_9TELE|nr:Protein prune [Liparis tanakae]
MEEFLWSCKESLKVDRAGSELHVVLGNEACDVDSMVCALTYAYFLSQTGDRLVLPLLNIREAELLLHGDNLQLLRQVGLSPHLLLFRDQLDLPALHRDGRLRLTLVDHNVLPSSDSFLEAAVVEVIDHHLLERDSSPSCPVTVETVGSCATLVTERIMQKAPEMLDQQVALLLYGEHLNASLRHLNASLRHLNASLRHLNASLRIITTPERIITTPERIITTPEPSVVLDCLNMPPSGGPGTPRDRVLLASLESLVPSLPDRERLYRKLQDARRDVSGLNTHQMLLKDMKSVSGRLNVGISVIYLPLEVFLQRAGLEAELSGFCLKLGFDLLLLMTISLSESQEPIRGLAAFSHSAACRQQVPAGSWRSHGGN